MKIIYTSLLSALLIFLSGCDQILNNNDPVAVATAFWGAALSEDPDDAHKYMVDSSVEIGIKGSVGEDIVTIGKVTQQGGYYFIETVINLVRNEEIVMIPVKTVVIPVDGLWRVDYWSTKQSVFDAAFDMSMEWFSMSIVNANAHMTEFLDAEKRDQILINAENRLNEEFERAKAEIIEELKAQITKKTEKEKAAQEKRKAGQSEQVSPSAVVT